MQLFERPPDELAHVSHPQCAGDGALEPLALLPAADSEQQVEACVVIEQSGLNPKRLVVGAPLLDVQESDNVEHLFAVGIKPQLVLTIVPKARHGAFADHERPVERFQKDAQIGHSIGGLDDLLGLV